MLYIFRQAVPPGGRPVLARDPVPLADARAAGGGNLVDQPWRAVDRGGRQVVWFWPAGPVVRP